MYKDKDKQREANKQASQRKRDKLKGVTAKELKAGVVIPYVSPRVIPSFKRGKDIKRFADLPPDVQATINRISESPEEKRRRTAIAIGYQHAFPDSYDKHLSFEQNESGGYMAMKVTGKPGDDDYNGVCIGTRAALMTSRRKPQI